MINNPTEPEYLEDFEGVLIDCKDPFISPYSVPGWRCKKCGWVIGSIGLPPAHQCPEEGIQQHCSHEWGEDTPYTDNPRLQDIVYRECSKCKKRQSRFKDSRWPA